MNWNTRPVSNALVRARAAYATRTQNPKAQPHAHAHGALSVLQPPVTASCPFPAWLKHPCNTAQAYVRAYGSTYYLRTAPSCAETMRTEPLPRQASHNSLPYPAGSGMWYRSSSLSISRLLDGLPGTKTAATSSSLERKPPIAIQLYTPSSSWPEILERAHAQCTLRVRVRCVYNGMPCLVHAPRNSTKY